MSVPSYVLISGPEQVIAERALASTLEAIREEEPDVEVVRLEGSLYEPGSLHVHTSPSLFGGRKAVVVRDLDEGNDALIEDLVAIVAQGSDAVLVVTHKSGTRGKKALDALKKAKVRIIEAPAIKSDRDKTAFVTNEFRSKGRKVAPEAVRALLEAVGKDLRELAQACQQLVDDTTGVIDAATVERYHGGKVEATGFRVADAAVAGEAAEALRLLRHALATGLDPVPIVAVLASQLRQVARVASAGRGRSADLAKQLGMAPWQVDRARAAARGWDGDRLGRAIQAVAAADFDVKGGGRDPVYAVERAVLEITRQRAGGAT
ncbi:DNA polymerase III subunit delta [Luteipulveratus sp. YIM 133132]|uniref:DNA-directed DNA polymerase n=1 Tax=Luteipulveratus flavus TaxID=3031728 RepID=A0ABT6CDA0_9MICO|nr:MULTISPECIES: DNA polymerase III subunit delta [unclassified Luteipulveratus]MDE9366166.1 DNA polymerase III subunit delta [Luteipulveratus sp. YIM 133132]MDF8265256.1 DNA polymerase III subunit delta [Luteipulveratus sp. YIM 133296]